MLIKEDTKLETKGFQWTRVYYERICKSANNIYKIIMDDFICDRVSIIGILTDDHIREELDGLFGLLPVSRNGTTCSLAA